MPRASLLAPEIVATLRARHGLEFDKLALADRLALALAVKEGEVTHTRLVAIAGVHSRDGTLALQRLVHRGLLTALDRKRPVTYGIPDGPLTSRHLDLFAGLEGTLATASGAGLQGKGATLQARAVTLQAEPATLVAEPVTLVADAATLAAGPTTSLTAGPTTRRRATDPRVVEATILEFCGPQWRTAGEIGAHVERSPIYVRNTYLQRLVATGRLQLRFPTQRTSPSQEYRTTHANLTGAPTGLPGFP